jgi:N-methylhydantoinase A
VVLGRLPPDALLGGRMPIRAELARRAIEERIAGPMGLGLEEAAQGILTILNENLMQAIRVISVEKGFDPRKFTLVAFGGGGPLLASVLARELGIETVMVPAHPGLLCAHGLLVADVRSDFSQSRLANLKQAGAQGINAGFADLQRSVDAWFDLERIDPEQRGVERALDLRYAGQSHELTVPVQREDFRDGDLPALIARFREEHVRVYGYAPDGSVQIVTYRITARTPVAGHAGGGEAAHTPTSGSARTGSRRVHFRESGGFVDCPIYDRVRLAPDARIEGPAIFEQMDTTTVLLPGQIACVQPEGHLLLTFGST